MGLFSRRREPAVAVWQPPVPPDCSCVRHLDDDLLRTVVPYAASLAADIGHDPDPATVADLLSPGGLSVSPTELEAQRLPDSAATFVWTLGVYDDAQVHYEDDMALELDAALALQPGVDEVDWADREVFLVAAPTLCADGMLAAAALALLDERVRTAG
jgi:hypothetical protein